MTTSGYTRRHVLRTMLRGLALGAIAQTGVASVFSRSAFTFGDDAKIHLARLQYTGDGWNIAPNALTALLREVNAVTSIPTANQGSITTLKTGDLSLYPLLFMTGDRPFPALPEADRRALKQFFAAGGMLVVDSSDPDPKGGFRQSIERELAYVFPDQKLQRTASKHVLYKSFYLCKGNEGRVPTADYTDSIQDQGRIQVLYLYNDLLGAYDRSNPSSVRRQDWAYRLGVNIVMYALCLNYKDDQVHVPFILRRRQWTVP